MGVGRVPDWLPKSRGIFTRARLLKANWTEEEAAEAKRLLALTRPEGDSEFGSFVAHVHAGRPVRI